MSRNSLGYRFKISSFGESHGKAIGVLIDGCPAGLDLNLDAIQKQLNRRKPGQSELTTSRDESEEFEILSGVFDNKTTGAPICITIPNTGAKSSDYEAIKDVYRPGHADFTYDQKYHIRDYRGGGRSSARITAAWVAAGNIAEQYLQQVSKIEVVAWVDRIYNIKSNVDTAFVTRDLVDESAVRCPDKNAASLMADAILVAKNEGDSLGGTIACVIRNCPAGLGEPVFGKIQAEIGHAILNLNAVKGIEFGDGFESSKRKGSENNDSFVNQDGHIATTTNHSGGMLGGISNGESIFFKVAFKPTSSIKKQQQTVDTSGNQIPLNIEGRHDPCVLPRAVPIIEALTALVMADLFLENQTARLK
ncbi:MAG: chorismate synthase [Bacteroidia bacterium]|nr:chorismate synthase [Bacteroidia bacterium]